MAMDSKWEKKNFCQKIPLIPLDYNDGTVINNDQAITLEEQIEPVDNPDNLCDSRNDLVSDKRAGTNMLPFQRRK